VDILQFGKSESFVFDNLCFVFQFADFLDSISYLRISSLFCFIGNFQDCQFNQFIFDFEKMRGDYNE